MAVVTGSGTLSGTGYLTGIGRVIPSSAWVTDGQITRTFLNIGIIRYMMPVGVITYVKQDSAGFDGGLPLRSPVY